MGNVKVEIIFPVIFDLPNLYILPYFNCWLGINSNFLEKMNTVSTFEVQNEAIELITNVKKQVDELYLKQQIFGLTLETLELTRRFNLLLPKEVSLEDYQPAALSRLISLTQHLERNLIKELI